MNNSTGLVSIGMPVYNGQRYIEQAIDSILSQTYENIELIICDNASTDKTEEICREYALKDSRVSYYRNKKNIGAYRNFNKSFSLSNGEYFKWASHDDVLGAGFIEESIKVLKRRDDVAICIPRYLYINENSDVTSGQNVHDISIAQDTYIQRVKRFFNLQVASDDIVYAIFGLIRADVLRRTKLWEGYVSSEEILMLELLWYGKLVQIEKEEFKFRLHQESAFKKNRNPKDRLKWFNPDGKIIFQFPVWYLLAKYIGRIWSKPLSIRDKVEGEILVMYRAVRLWKRYAGDIVKFFTQIF